MAKQKQYGELISREEALMMLSKQLRRPNLEPDAFLKVMTAYAKLNGWLGKDAAPPPSPKDSEPALDDLVAALKKERERDLQ